MSTVSAPSSKRKSRLESLLLRIGEELPSTSLPFEERRQMLGDALTLLGVKEGATNTEVKAAVKQLTAAVGISEKTLHRYLQNQAQPKRKYKKSKSPSKPLKASAEPTDSTQPSFHMAQFLLEVHRQINDAWTNWLHFHKADQRELRGILPALIKTLQEMLKVVGG